MAAFDLLYDLRDAASCSDDACVVGYADALDEAACLVSRVVAASARSSEWPLRHGDLLLATRERDLGLPPDLDGAAVAPVPIRVAVGLPDLKTLGFTSSNGTSFVLPLETEDSAILERVARSLNEHVAFPCKAVLYPTLERFNERDASMASIETECDEADQFRSEIDALVQLVAEERRAASV
jgi:hypothetical protein